MKKIALTLSLLTLLGAAPGFVAPALAQTPAAPATPGAAGGHGELRAALQQLDLKPRQKLDIMKVVKNAEASGQDPKQTLQQIIGTLDPAQKEKLMQLMAAKKAGAGN